MPIVNGKPECFGRFPLETGGNQECDYCPHNLSCETKTKKQLKLEAGLEVLIVANVEAFIEKNIQEILKTQIIGEGMKPLTRSDLIEFYYRV